MDVLTRFFARHLTPARWIKVLMLALCLLAYGAFHQVRLSLPHGFWRASLPSLLVMPVMLGFTDLFPSIRFHTWRKKVVITLAATLVGILWFEFAVPGFYSRSTRDLGDVTAMVLGWVLYLTVDRAGIGLASEPADPGCRSTGGAPLSTDTPPAPPHRSS